MTIESLLALLSNPFIAALLGTFLSPLLAKMPMFNTILQFVAGLVGMKLVPITPPAPTNFGAKEAFEEVTRMQTTNPIGYATDPAYLAKLNEASIKAAAEKNQAQGILPAGLDLSKIMQFLPIILIGFLLLNSGGGCPKKPTPTPTPTPAPKASATPVKADVPSAELQSIVARIKTLAVSNPAAAVEISQFYIAASDVVRRDSTKITSTNQFSVAKDDAELVFAGRTALIGALPGLGQEINTVLVASVGSPSRDPLSPAIRIKLADTMNAVAWALGG